MTDQLTDAELQAARRVLYSLNSNTCKACDGTGNLIDAEGRVEPLLPCIQCHGSGTVNILDRLAQAVQIIRLDGESDESLRLRFRLYIGRFNT